MTQPLTLTEEQYSRLSETLLDSSGKTPLAKRFRSLFTLRAVASDRAVEIIGSAISDESALLGHEVAYVLGQIGSAHALPILKSTLADERRDPMVRHEAAEAMAAISDPSVLPILEQYAQDKEVAVRETCEIAIAKIKWDHGPGAGQPRIKGSYESVDPAPPEEGTAQSTETLRKKLLDHNLPLFERYRAMFSLRNLGTRDAVLALAEGFSDSSALFRHEIAYVFGQLSSSDSVPALLEVLRNPNEVDMVRHEAAEALGSIAEPDLIPILEEYRSKGPRVVKESCEVALDMAQYELAGEFQYADGLTA